MYNTTPMYRTGVIARIFKQNSCRVSCPLPPAACTDLYLLNMERSAHYRWYNLYVINAKGLGNQHLTTNHAAIAGRVVSNGDY